MSETSVVSVAEPDTEDVSPFAPEVLYEVVDGEFRELESMGNYEVTLASVLSHLLNGHAFPQRAGVAMSECLFQLRESPRLRRRPDLAFVSSRQTPPGGWSRENPLNVVPDLVAEFVSPNDLADEIEQKVGEYLEAGVRLVWVVYSSTERVHAFCPDHTARVFDRDQAVDAGDVLPGFEFRFRDLTDLLAGPEPAS